jgi:hypothetical protein
VDNEIILQYVDLVVHQALSAESACDHINRMLSRSAETDYIQYLEPPKMLRLLEMFLSIFLCPFVQYLNQFMFINK